MKDIVTEILETEKRVEELLRRAREEASSIKQNAERDANRRIADARSQAQSIIRDAVAKAEKEAEETRKRALHQAEQESRVKIDRVKGSVDEVVVQIVAMIRGGVFE